jgi:hypothetical protein
VAEVVALAWKWFVRLACRGKDAKRFARAIATFAARAVRSGRRLCGQERARDVHSSVARRRHGFSVASLPAYPPAGSLVEEALRDDTHTAPDASAAFRIDFPAWLNTLPDRDRKVAEALMVGERTTDVAHHHGLSPARVSQLRRELMDRWHDFHGGHDAARA